MHIYCLGINHNTASLHLREKFAFNDEKTRAALARLGHPHKETSISEMVIISTCNRVELYAISKRENAKELEDFLIDSQAISRDELIAHRYIYADMDAVAHLLNVSAGLDSLVLGEPQILGQVTHALELARGQGAVGSILSRLFQTAIHAGKRARTETRISRNPASVSSLAASLAAREVSDLENAQIVILGAGEMAELAVESLRKRGATRVLVVNRTLKRALALGIRWGAEASTFEHLESALERADILIASTGAPHIIVHAPMVAEAMEKRAERPLVMIDIAVPRDISAEVGDIENINLYDMDGLNAQLEDSLAQRAAEVPRVEQILAEEEASFADFLASLEMLPLIATLRKQADEIRQAELQKTLRRLSHLDEKDHQRIEILTQALVKKLIDAPIRRLRVEATNGHAPEYATVTRALFDLSE